MTAVGAEYTGKRALFYDHVATGVEGDTAFYVAEAIASGASVLELGCGTGRILIPVAAAGVASFHQRESFRFKCRRCCAV